MNVVEIQGGFLVPSNDTHVGKWQRECQKLNHDNFTIPFVLNYLKEDDVVIDIGSFNGDHAVEYSRKVSSKGFVFCIEPGETAYHCLKHNVKRFQNNNSFAIQAAISDGFEMVVHEEIDNLAASECIEVDMASDKYLICQPLCWLFQCLGIKSFQFMKIDCQGYEYKALLGCTTLLRAHKPTLLVCINEGLLTRHGGSRELVFAFLRDLQYKFFIIQPECRFESPQYDILAEKI